MIRYTTNDFKSGLKIMLDGTPYAVIENEFVKPGKGQAFSRVKLRNLLTGRVLDKTFKSGEAVDSADVIDIDAQYLYYDSSNWHFMANESFEQFTADDTAMADAKSWLKEQDTCVITLWNAKPINVTPPNFVNLTVVNTDPGLKGDTSGGGNKPATLETGAIVRIPLFVQEGEMIKVDTRTGEYVSRVKE